MIIRSEDLAYWFLRLNGFLTIQNFVVHPDEGRDQRTDVDILGVRFPHRKELLNNPMEDYPLLTNNKKSLVVFCEVKTGTCSLNGPWTTPGKKNMQRVLKALGTHPQKSISKIAAMLYKHGKYRDRKSEISLLCIGKSNNPALKKTFFLGLSPNKSKYEIPSKNKYQ